MNTEYIVCYSRYVLIGLYTQKYLRSNILGINTNSYYANSENLGSSHNSTLIPL